jgi:hypothetical protein
MLPIATLKVNKDEKNKSQNIGYRPNYLGDRISVWLAIF